MEYIEWTLDKINEYLEGKEKERGVDPKELLVMSEFIREHKFKRMFELGTYFGVAGNIIGTSSPCIDVFVSSDIAEHEKELGRIRDYKYEEYGKYLPKGTIFIKGDFRDIMFGLLEKYKFEFAFIDDGHSPLAIAQQLNACYKNKVKYIALHDTNLRKVRRGLNFAINKGMYKILFEMRDAVKNDIKAKKGISFMEIVE